MTSDVNLQVRFKNQIYGPLILVIRELTVLPRVVDPDSNMLLHTFEGLVLHVNHFKEKHANFLKQDDILNAVANSIKHVRQKEPIELQTCGVWEHLDQKFRFLTMTHLLTRRDRDVLDAVDLIISRVNYISEKLATGLPKIIRETATHEFYDWAVCYSAPFISAETSSMRIRLVTKNRTGVYVASAVESIKFLALDESLAGIDPTPYFPSVTA
ncbi:hypothetical protein [Agrobacterium rosae]|uniref:Uncharacterized protein n=1 Tax=Agrobacterium rosae TaxID=1972867 RepID=A0AAW9FAB9_9HYPH|nr:hypothetical protein [Agrobacterium rosae]MDX8300644.1 hypothetical protein [Agrobacterium rosae]